MTDQPKGEPGNAVPPVLDVPPTRKFDTEPPARESHMSLDAVPAGFPDDGDLARGLRTVDNYVGLGELSLLVGIFAAVVIVASLSALSGHIFHHQIGQWWNFVVRKGTFAIAMLGAAYATHQQRLLAMDLISRRLSARGRLVLGVALKLFTVVVTSVLLYIGMYLHRKAMPGPELDLTIFTLTEPEVILMIPIGAALIIFHSLVHAAIDIDYLARNKLPPERARSGH